MRTLPSPVPARSIVPRPPWRELLQSYPIAAFAAVGIAVGLTLLPFGGLPARFAFGVVAIGGGLPLLWATLRQMVQGRFNVDTIAALAILGSALLGQYLAGALVVLMQSGGEALEDYGLRRANRSLDNLLRRAPSIAHRKRGETVEDVPAADVVIGDILIVRPGDILAADGVVVEGQGSVDESALTGEPVPLAKQVGDDVFSGTINLTGNLQVKATSAAAQSKYERIVRMVQAAQGERAPINRLANRFAPAMTLVTLLTAGGVLVLTRDPVRALAVLVVATPCPLIIATPLAVLSAINRAAAQNILVKSGAAIEQAGAIQSVVFDKTGTLTSGTPTLRELRCFPQEAPLSLTEQDLLAAVAGVEMMSPNVLADAVVQAARARGLTPTMATDVQETPGTGVSGSYGGRRITLGSGSYLQARGVVILETIQAERMRLSAEGRTVAYVGVDDRLTGLLIFEDRLRPEAKETVRRLEAMGIRRIAMFTGDATETAKAVADQVGITEVRARMQPEDKLAAIRKLAEEGPVMMVGDGINDAPALATATVGVAMGGYGAGIATDSADVVITVESVERVADMIAIGRRMTRVAQQGIYFGLGASLLLMILASLGYIAPPVGALLQEGIDLATILNALRSR